MSQKFVKKSFCVLEIWNTWVAWLPDQIFWWAIAHPTMPLQCQTSWSQLRISLHWYRLLTACWWNPLITVERAMVDKTCCSISLWSTITVTSPWMTLHNFEYWNLENVLVWNFDGAFSIYLTGNSRRGNNTSNWHWATFKMHACMYIATRDW